MSQQVSAPHAIISRNIFSLAGVQIANLVLPLVTLPYLLRVLGVEQFGVYVLCQAVIAYAVVITDYGFNLSATARMAQAQGKVQTINSIFWSVQAAKLILALLALGLLALVVVSVPQFRSSWSVMLASTPAVFGAVLFPQWLFQGLERMGFIAVCTVAARSLAIPVTFWSVQSTQDTWLAALVQSSGPVVAGLLACGFIWHRQLIGWTPPRWLDVRQAYSDGWHLFLSTLAISLYTNTSAIVLGLLASHSAVGLFSAADKIRLACQSVITPLSSAVYPRVTALMAQNQNAGLALVRQVLLIQGGLTFGISCGLWLLAPWAVQFIMGEQFDTAVYVLRVLSPLPFLVGLSNVFGIQTLVPLGLKKSFSRIVMASGLVNLVLLLVFVPRWEAEGAAAAVLLTEGLVTLVMAMVLRKNKIYILATTNPFRHQL